LGIPRRLGKPVVEAATASSRNIDQNAIESKSSFFVGIEALIQKVAQETTGLRTALTVDADRWGDGAGSVLHIGSKVAEGSKPQTRHNRICGNVDIFVDLSRLKSSVQMNKLVAGNEFAVDDVRKLPIAAWNDRSRPAARVAHGEHIARIVGNRNRVFDAANMPRDEVPEGISGAACESMRSPRNKPVIVFPLLAQLARTAAMRWPGCVPLPTEAHYSKSPSQ